MKVFGKVLMVLCLVSVASAQLTTVCPTYRELGRDQYKSNTPQRTGGVGTALVGFTENPSIIFIKTNPAKLGQAKVYDKKGNLLFSAPRLSCASRPKGYFRGECLSRYKANVKNASTRVMRRKAIRQTGSPEAFWKVSSTLCVRVMDLGKCYNVKVRGKCDGRILG